MINAQVIAASGSRELCFFVRVCGGGGRMLSASRCCMEFVFFLLPVVLLQIVSAAALHSGLSRHFLRDVFLYGWVVDHQKCEKKFNREFKQQ